MLSVGVRVTQLHHCHPCILDIQWIFSQVVTIKFVWLEEEAIFTCNKNILKYVFPHHVWKKKKKGLKNKSTKFIKHLPSVIFFQTLASKCTIS